MGYGGGATPPKCICGGPARAVQLRIRVVMRPRSNHARTGCTVCRESLGENQRCPGGLATLWGTQWGGGGIPGAPVTQGKPRGTSYAACSAAPCGNRSPPIRPWPAAYNHGPASMACASCICATGYAGVPAQPASWRSASRISFAYARGYVGAFRPRSNCTPQLLHASFFWPRGIFKREPRHFGHLNMSLNALNSSHLARTSPCDRFTYGSHP